MNMAVEGFASLKDINLFGRAPTAFAFGVDGSRRALAKFLSLK